MRTLSRDDYLRYGLVAVIVGIFGMFLGSNVVALVLKHHPLLGGPMVVHQGIAIYAPWDLLVWSFRWGSRVKELQLGWIVSASTLALLMVMAMRYGKSSAVGKPVCLDKNDGWGTESELRHAGMLPGDGFGQLDRRT